MYRLKPDFQALLNQAPYNEPPTKASNILMRLISHSCHQIGACASTDAAEAPPIRPSGTRHLNLSQMLYPNCHSSVKYVGPTLKHYVSATSLSKWYYVGWTRSSTPHVLYFHMVYFRWCYPSNIYTSTTGTTESRIIAVGSVRPCWLGQGDDTTESRPLLWDSVSFVFIELDEKLKTHDM